MYLLPPLSSYVINDSLLMVTSLDTALLQKVFLVLNLPNSNNSYLFNIGHFLHNVDT